MELKSPTQLLRRKGRQQKEPHPIWKNYFLLTDNIFSFLFFREQQFKLFFTIKLQNLWYNIFLPCRPFSIIKTKPMV